MSDAVQSTSHPAWMLIGIAILAVAGLFLLDQLGLWLERKGWLYYRKVKRKGTLASNALLQFQSFFEPETQHLLETRQEQQHKDHRIGASDDETERKRTSLP